MELVLESAGIKLKLDEKAIDKRHVAVYRLSDNCVITILHVDDALKILKFIAEWLTEYFDLEV